MGNLQKVHSTAAGIDVGACKFFVGTEDGKVENFKTFTSGCHQAVEYLQQKGVTSVAMEATGVYWITLHDMLREAGFEVHVVNGRHVKHVPGRKTDVQDCLWIQELHSHGLLRKSFIPPDEVLQLRDYMRIREKDIESKVRAVQRMDKALVMMNIRLSSVISGIQTVSAMSIIEAILQGERKAEVLLQLCDGRILKTKRDEVLESLNGFYKEEKLFALQHAWNEYQFYEESIKKCDAEIEKILKKQTEHKKEPSKRPAGKRIYHNKPQIKDLDKMMMQIFDDKDLTVLPGMTSYSALKFYSVVGNDFSNWPTEKHFAAHLALAVSRYQSGKSRKYRKVVCNTEGGQILKECVQPLLKSKHNALGAFGKRIAARRGPAVAIKAMARKLAVWIYRIHNKGLEFVENGIKMYEEQQNKQKMKWLEKQAKQLNMVLTPSSEIGGVH